jgi:hypothetical protein
MIAASDDMSAAGVMGDVKQGGEWMPLHANVLRFKDRFRRNKAQRLFVYFAESISPITVSFCPTTVK